MNYSRLIFYVLALLALLGLITSGYALNHHHLQKVEGITDAVCNINELFSCDELAKSAYSELFGTPLAVFGLGYFIGLLCLLAVSYLFERFRQSLLQVYVVLAAIGLVVSIVLGTISVVAIQFLCLTCMTVYGITVLQVFSVFKLSKTLFKREFNLRAFAQGFLSYGVMVLAVIGIYHLGKPDIEALRKSYLKYESSRKEGLIIDYKHRNILINTSKNSGPGEDFRLGPDDAPLVVVEYIDFQCPSCRRFHTKLQQLKKIFGDKMQLVVKNYPLDQACNTKLKTSPHPLACRTALIARCAGDIGKFWPLHDKIFENQRDLTEENLGLWTSELGLTAQQLASCLNSEAHSAKIKRDIAEADALGIQGTPLVFINGYEIVKTWSSAESLRAEIEKRFLRD